jgi:small subunit ribosomal protein S21|tara:strand:- start:296 stop:493 length:198 start_codon:yes stop_codon:yes gene_type:complete
MLYVKVGRNKSIEKAISIFKRKVKESGLMLELRERSFYKKPSADRREKKNKAKLRNKYKVLREKD